MPKSQDYDFKLILNTDRFFNGKEKKAGSTLAQGIITVKGVNAHHLNKALQANQLIVVEIPKKEEEKKSASNAEEDTK